MEKTLVSILIALRNESKNTQRLFAGLDKLTFPKDEYELILADDDSDDTTWEQLQSYARGKANVKVIKLPPAQKNDNLKGKTRVLARLGQEAKGKYFLYTDADIDLPPDWIQGMIAPFLSNQKLGISVGITALNAASATSALQGMEWLSVLYLLTLFEKMGILGTGMGNNMAISREAYMAVGGYEHIPFSIVEDYAIYLAIIQKGFESTQLFSNTVLAETIPPENYLAQRKRWFSGALFHKSPLLISVFLTIAYWLGVFILAFIQPSLSILVALPGVALISILTFSWVLKLKKWQYLPYLPIFIIYLPMSNLIVLIYALFSKKVVWKNRSY